MVVAQLAERSRPMPEVHRSNPVIGNISYWTYLLLTVENTKIKKKKRAGMAHLKAIFWKPFSSVEVGRFNFGISAFKTEPVWPDVEIKSIPNFSKNCPKTSQSSPKLQVMLFKIAQIVSKHLGYFCGLISHQGTLKNRPIWSHWMEPPSAAVTKSRLTSLSLLESSI